MTDTDLEVFARATEFAAKNNCANISPSARTFLPLDATLVTFTFHKDEQKNWGWYFERGDITKLLFTGADISLFVSDFYTRHTFLGSIKSVNLRGMFAASFWVCLSLIPIVLVALLIRAGLSINLSTSNFIQIIALSALVISVILLIGNIVTLIDMPPAMRNGIVSTFFLSVLGSAATYIAHEWNSPRHSLHVNLYPLSKDTFTYTKDNKEHICLKDYSLFPTASYPKPVDNNVIIPVLLAISDYQADDDGKPNISFYSEFYADRLGDAADINKPHHVHDVDYASTSVQPGCPPRDLAKIRSDFHLNKNDIVVIAAIADLHPDIIKYALEAGSAAIVVHVIDRQNNVHVVSEPINVTFF